MSAAAPPNDDKKHAVDESLLEPFAYISSIPGKDVRSALIDCFNSWLRVPEKGEGDHLDGLDVLSEIKCIVSSLHDASLLIDDVEDDSNLRRGAPVAHAIFGVPPTINAANYVYFLALERCLALGNEGAMRVSAVVRLLFFVSEFLPLRPFSTRTECRSFRFGGGPR
jgi:geranylgeranyl diphosphate synthase type 3